MVQVKVGGSVRDYPEETTWLEVANEYQHGHEDDVLLMRINGKFQGLRKHMKDGEFKFITVRGKPGMTTYQRSTSLIVLKAFHTVVGAESVDKIVVDLSLGGGFFMGARGNFVLDETFLLWVKNKIAEYAAQETPIIKHNVSADGAVELFHRHRMYDKECLFHYRRVSRVNIYSADRLEGYYYRYMVQDTGHVRYPDLAPHHYGLILMMPSKEEPRTIRESEPKDKLFVTLSKSTGWGRHSDLETVDILNDEIAQGEMSHLILIQEALQGKEIAEITAQIASRRGAKFVMIAGPSPSGKTISSHRLSVQLGATGLKPHPIAVDSYFTSRTDSPRDEQGDYNYEVLECLDIGLLNQNMTDLLAGKRIELPYYNFEKGVREHKGNFLQLGAEDILVIEGIRCSNGKLPYSLLKESKFRIYISALAQLNIDEHGQIPAMNGRPIRRMVWDVRTRESSAQDAVHTRLSVRKREEENILPFQEETDTMFNSALVYGFAVLKQYTEPLLFSVPKDSEEYLEAKRLLEFLDYFIGVNGENIPKNSIPGEFVGEGYLNA